MVSHWFKNNPNMLLTKQNKNMTDFKRNYQKKNLEQVLLVSFESFPDDKKLPFSSFFSH